MIDLPHIPIPRDISPDEMPDLLRYWYLGSKARRHMMLRRFAEVDAEIGPCDPRAGSCHLDIGSAWGYNILALAKIGIDAVGLDLVVDQFGIGARIAAAAGLPFRVVGADASRLPFADASFSSISMVETLEHVFEDDRDRVFSECRRVLRTGGRLILSTPNPASLVERAKRIVMRFPSLRRRLPAMMYPTETVSRTDYHPYRYHKPWTAAKIAGRLESHGYKVLKIKRFLFVYKNAPDWACPILIPAEKIFERLPLIGRMAATVCVVAVKH
ncbi:MAG: class I SAM-dependent methyltransferase [Candidatus Latescibacterota bacterium]|nr:MAG: class I SAM-dependent methyltransferase [Candidatus Latescibacterota bacterium]